MNHALLPIGSSFPTLSGVFITLDTGHPVSAWHALLAAIAALYENSRAADTVYLDLAHMARELAQAATVKREYGAYLKAAVAVLIAAVEHGATSPESLQPLAKMTGGGMPGDAKLTELLIHVDTLLSEHAQGAKDPLDDKSET